MVASTVFFLTEAQTVGAHWKTSLHVGMLVTLIAAVHYFYMREYWVTIKQTPIVYRYIDWSLIVPLQMIEFYCILKAVKPDLGAGLFWRLLVGAVVMLDFGYLGEQSRIQIQSLTLHHSVSGAFFLGRLALQVSGLMVC